MFRIEVSWTALSLAAASVCAADTLIDPGIREAGMRAAPQYVRETGIECTPVDARYIKPYRAANSSVRDKPTNDVLATGAKESAYAIPDDYNWVMADRYEVACQQGPGYVLIAGDEKNVGGNARKAQAYLCLEAEQMSAGKAVKVGTEAIVAAALNEQRCVLPGNSPEAQRTALGALATKGGVACGVEQMRSAGRSGSNTYIEMGCSDGTGVLLAAPFPLRSSASIQAAACFSVPENSKIQCELTDRTRATAAVDALMAKTGAECQVSSRRLIGTAKNGDSLYEFACSGQQGYIIRTSIRGEVVGGVLCGDPEAASLGGCRLSKPPS